MKGEKQNMNKFLQKVAKIFLGLSMATGVGVAISSGRKSAESVKADSYEQLTSIANIDESAQYVLGVEGYGGGKGFHKSGTSSWGVCTSSDSDTPLYYTLKKGANNANFTAKTTISGTTYYLQVPTSSNTFSMNTSSTAANTTLIIGTTQVSGTNYAVANSGTTNRHLRVNGTSGLRSYAGTTGSMAFFYKVISQSTTYTVTYDGNENDSGNVPNGGSYAAGVSVTVSGNTGNLAKTGYTFGGWTLNEDGTGTVYGPTYTTTYTMGSANVTFYAKWDEDTPTPGGDSYQKVTATNQVTAGDYLIVYETGNLAFNGGLSTLDAVGNTIGVSISNNKIEANATTNAAKFTLASVTGGFSIKSASGYYIGRTTNSNGLNSSTSEAYTNTISISDGNATITSSANPVLKYNSASNQTRFRYFGSGQQAIQLYKKVSTGPQKLDPPGKPSYNSNSQQLTWSAVSNASGYQYTIDGGNTWADVTDSTNRYHDVASWTDNQSYTVAILAKGDGTNYTNSDASESLTFTKVTTPVYTSVTVTPGSLQGDTKKTAYIICDATATGTNIPASPVFTWYVTENTTYDTTTSVVDKATIDSNGKVTFLDNCTVYIWALAPDGSTHNSATSVTASGLIDPAGSENNPYTVGEAIDAIDNSGDVTEVYATGIVSQIVAEYSSQYSNITFDISSDGSTTGSQLRAYRCVSGSTYNAEDVEVGATVKVKGDLTYYTKDGVYEFSQGCTLEYLHTKTLTSVAIEGDMSTKEYWIGDSWDFSGLKIEGYYDNDPNDHATLSTDLSASVAADDLIFDLDNDAPDSTSIDSLSFSNIAWGDSMVLGSNKTISGIVVHEAITITGVSITGDMTKKSYTSNESWDYSGLFMTVSYSGGKPSESTALATAVSNLDIEFTANPASPTVGTTSLTLENIEHVIFDGEIADKTISGISVTAAPSVQTWDLSVDETSTASTTELRWTSTNVSMLAEKDDSTTNTNNYYPGTSGQSYTSTRFYKGSKLTITPNTNVTISSVVFTCTTTGYANALAGGWTNATASVSGSIVTITPTDGKSAFYAVIGGTTGSSSVSITYTVKSLSSITFAGDPVSPQYIGYDFDYTGLTFTAHYTDNTSDTILGSAISWNSLVAGQNPSGTYGGSTVTVTDVSVLADTLSSISISGSMTKTQYKAGADWDPSGLIVTGSYTSGNKVVTDDVEWSYSIEHPAINTTSVVVTATFGGETDSVEVTGITIVDYDYVIEAGRYYIMNDDLTYGISTAAATNTRPSGISQAEEDNNLLPFTFTLVGDYQYEITTVIDNTTYYLVNNNVSASGNNDSVRITTESNLVSGATKIWEIQTLQNGLYSLVTNTYDGGTPRYLTEYLTNHDFRGYVNQIDNNSQDYKLSIIPEGYFANKIAEEIMDDESPICNGGSTAPNVERWNEIAGITYIHNEISMLSGVTAAQKDASGETPDGTLFEKAMARYDEIMVKYNTQSLTTYVDFLGRIESQELPIRTSHNILFAITGKDTNTVAIIVIISMVSVTAIGGYFFLRKRKEN